MTHRFATVCAWLLCAGALLAQDDSISKAPKLADMGPYVLEVTAAPAHQPDMTRYLVSLQMPEGDRVSSVYGTNVHPVSLRAPEGVFNSPYNGSWSASGMNPKFFEIMPDMKDDTYATIGLTTGAKISGLAGAEDPTMVQDSGEPWDEFFSKSGETQMDIRTHTGGAYFVLRTASNGAPVDGKVLLMQVTTPGAFSGALNVQIFPASDAYDQVRYRFEFTGTGTFEGVSID